MIESNLHCKSLFWKPLCFVFQFETSDLSRKPDELQKRSIYTNPLLGKQHTLIIFIRRGLAWNVQP